MLTEWKYRERIFYISFFQQSSYNKCRNFGIWQITPLTLKAYTNRESVQLKSLLYTMQDQTNLHCYKSWRKGQNITTGCISANSLANAYCIPTASFLTKCSTSNNKPTYKCKHLLTLKKKKKKPIKDSYTGKNNGLLFTNTKLSLQHIPKETKGTFLPFWLLSLLA